ncbi:uncharacterized protein LOC129231825 isoform X2 [Uloborus diversus]|uniref:uncharacterized protein LOC129231825 isoform X2 n=1 Tax=Uloborus diversus TaxID=327109 RepID=UPI00240A05C8|nr:uncharacterized protein LOC129231825 isoform X2 [Uloborus diversus]
MDSELWYVTRIFSEKTNQMDVLYLKHKLSFILRTYTKKRHTFYQLKSQIFHKICKGYLGSEVLNDSFNRLLTFIGGQLPEDVQRDAGGTIITNHKHQRWRQMEELTHLKIKLNASVRRSFFSHDWLLERVCSGDPYLLLEEIKLYRRRNPDDREFDILRKLLQMSSFALMQDGKQLYSQLHGRVRNFFADFENSIKYPTIKRLYLMSATPKVPSFISRGPCLRTIADAQNPHKSLSSNETQYFSKITWLDQDAKYFATVSSDLDNVSVWSAVQLKRVTTLTDVTCVEDLVPLRQGTAEVLLVHHNRMDLYDLAKGTQTAQMVELVDMSQSAKVLPEGKKILAVSATHDTLLLFEVVTGHVAFRMSAGEKRRLEGLTLSGNGHMCVCGDGLRKPYPLLAWDIRKGTLLQQMSIRHHEYVIRFTRVDEEGRKVIAVAKDLLDSSPSFVVVYDLATGGLLWETRAGASLTALDFCRERNLVLAATSDRKIHAWEGAKGAKRMECRPPDLLNPPHMTSTQWNVLRVEPSSLGTGIPGTDRSESST